ncbi:hypothetical protein DVH05_006137 [Phytophthora capsici]|nr:hypothetical protein DVH05_006137 [Phytophthora capsici]
MCVVRLPETGQHSAKRAALDFIVPHPDAFHRYQYLQHAHRRRLVYIAQGHHPAAHGADDPVENYKQVLKALKGVSFSSPQMGDVMRRRRERLAKRLQAVVDETELLRAHFVENDLTQRQCQELQDDLEQAQTLGQPELLKDLVDELKPTKKEHQGRVCC